MKSKYNFSGRHWLTIAICFVLFLLANAVTSDSENVIIPVWAGINGFDFRNAILPLFTVAGCVSIIGNLVLGKVCEKVGAKAVIVFCLLAAIVFIFLYGTAKSIPVFLIGLIGTICFGQSLSYLGANAIIANWFPHKKGLAMSFISVGPPAATIVMTMGIKRIVETSVNAGIYSICGVLLVVAIVCILFLKNTPEQIGCSPDNMTAEELAILAEEEKKNEVKSTVLTTGQVLKRKEFWLIAAIIGICSITQTGLMAQWLDRYAGTAFEGSAATLMSICAVVGIFGSMIAGNIENRMGTKKGFIFLAIWFAVALVLNFTEIKVFVYISVIMFALIITLFQTFMPAFELSCFGRDNFKQVNAIMFPILSICGQLSFVVISICNKIFGVYRSVYILFAILLLISIIPTMLLPIGDNK